MLRINALKLFDKFLTKEALGKRLETPSDIETCEGFLEKRQKADRIMRHEANQQMFNDKLLRR
ncbi:MAG TPA: hypothetical protein VJ279_08380 [Hanamia sp.]|jgi:hypothetical protein|nr:hypothetical protein [Hanamia sp.]